MTIVYGAVRRSIAQEGGITERLDNFSVTLDGSDVPVLPGFTWHLGYRHLSAGQGDVADEYGYIAGFVQETELSDDWGIAFNGEYALLKNTGGTANNTSYATGGLTVTHGSWHLDLAATLRDVDVSGGPDNHDVLWQASLGFTDQNDIDWNLGYRFTEVANVESHTFGLFVTQAIGFSTR